MGIAILWIMIYHIPCRTDLPIIKDIFSIGYGGVDIFLFLSGFGLYFSLSKKDTKLSQYYKKRFCRILPEFWLFLIFTYIISNDFDFQSLANLIYRATTIGYWIPHTPYNLWYISSILFFYTIYPFYYRKLKEKGVGIGFIAIGIGFVLIIIYALVMTIYFHNKNEGGLLILTIARIPIFFIGSLWGYFAKESIVIKIPNKVILLILALLIMSLLSLKICKNSFQEYLWTCSLYFLPFIIIAPILCILIAKLLDMMPDIISTIFSKIGSMSLELYIVHEYLYSNLFTHLAVYGEFVSVIILIIISFILAFILYHINKRCLQIVCRTLLNYK